jgi:lipopolysaccharide biosynthesis glycosyltransferase
VLLDYGLTKGELEKLEKEPVKVYSCKQDARVNNIRFRDMANYLKKHKYDQVLSIDGGDIIFQKDISSVFNTDKTSFRAVCEEITLQINKFNMKMIFKDFFYENDVKKILKTIRGKEMINCGVIFGPSDKFRKMCEEAYDLIKDKTKFGPEQIAINYVLHRDGFVRLDRGYNFMLARNDEHFYIKRGIFYYRDNEKIPIVHNVGYKLAFRPVTNFGYGPRHNKLKKFTYYTIKNMLKTFKEFEEFFLRKNTLKSLGKRKKN